jgi:hypothetical protein
MSMWVTMHSVNSPPSFESARHRENHDAQLHSRPTTLEKQITASGLIRIGRLGANGHNGRRTRKVMLAMAENGSPQRGTRRSTEMAA